MKTITTRTYDAVCRELARGFADVHKQLLELQDNMVVAARLGKKVHGLIAWKYIAEMMVKNSECIEQVQDFKRFFEPAENEDLEEDEYDDEIPLP